MDKKPLRPAKISRVLNSTCAGRPATSVPQSAVKDIRTKRSTMRGPNATLADQTFAAPSLATTERECEAKLEYNKLLQSIFMDCMLDDTEEREKTELDGMMAQLAERCEKNLALLDKTHKRLSEISFLSEKERILEMKELDTGKFLEELKTSKAEDILSDLTQKQQSYLDRVETKNVDLGYNEETGHKQLLDAMEDALKGLNSIREQCKLTPEMIKDYSDFNNCCDKVENQMKELDDLKKEFDAKYPSLSERAVIKSSEEFGKLIDDHFVTSESE